MPLCLPVHAPHGYACVETEVDPPGSAPFFSWLCMDAFAGSAGTVDASDLVKAPVLFAMTDTGPTPKPVAVLNVNEATLRHLCDMHGSLAPLFEKILAAQLIPGEVAEVDFVANPPVALRV